LNKHNLFIGDRFYFSGGAVAAFDLYNFDGHPICSGAGYGYRGFIKEDGIEAAIREEETQETLVTLTTDCK
jgi:hypothetical protein